MGIKINGMNIIVIAVGGCVWLQYSGNTIEVSSILPKGRGMTLMEKIQSLSGELSEFLPTNTLKDAA